MKIYDLGEKMSGQDMPVKSAENKNEKYYPSVHLTKKQFPPIAEHEVDDEVDLIIKVRVCGVSKRMSRNENEESYDLELLSASIKENK